MKYLLLGCRWWISATIIHHGFRIASDVVGLLITEHSLVIFPLLFLLAEIVGHILVYLHLSPVIRHKLFLLYLFAGIEYFACLALLGLLVDFLRTPCDDCTLYLLVFLPFSFRDSRHSFLSFICQDRCDRLLHFHWGFFVTKCLRQVWWIVHCLVKNVVWVYCSPRKLLLFQLSLATHRRGTRFVTLKSIWCRWLGTSEVFARLNCERWLSFLFYLLSAMV